MIIKNIDKLNNAISTDIEIYDNRKNRILPGDIISGIYRKKFITGIVKEISSDKSALCLLKNATTKQGKLYPDNNDDGSIVLNELLTDEEKNEYYQLDEKFKNRYKEIKHTNCLSFIYHNKITGECGITMRSITYTGNFKKSDWEKWKTDNIDTLNLYDLFVLTDKLNYISELGHKHLFFNINDIHYTQIAKGLWQYYGTEDRINIFFPNVVDVKNNLKVITAKGYQPFNSNINCYFYIPDEPELNSLKKYLISIKKLNLLETDKKIGYYIVPEADETACFNNSSFIKTDSFKSEWNRIILENGYNKKFLKENII